MMDNINILGVKVSATNLRDVMNYLIKNIESAKGSYICFSNAYTTVIAKENEAYRNIQNKAFLSLPDGKPLSFIGCKLSNKKISRVTGPDFMESILQRSRENNWQHFFYGNTKENLELLIQNLKKQYPYLRIKGYEPSVFRDLKNKEKESLIKRINLSGADFVWIGLGAPRQEIFCSELSGKTQAVWVAVGGAFNIIAETMPRAPKWMQKCCLEWFYRWMHEPKRLFKRYFITNLKFLYYTAKDIEKMLLLNRGS